MSSAAAPLLPRTLAERVSGRPAASLESFRHPLRGSVLVADMVAFTALTEEVILNSVQKRRGPEDVRSILQRYLSSLCRCVEAFGGDIVVFSGDSVQAVWPDRGDPAEAARVAADCALAIVRLDPPAPVAGLAPLERAPDFRVTVASGDFCLTSVGSPKAGWNHVLEGEAVRQATAAQSAASRRSVVVHRSTMSLLGDAFPADALGSGLFQIVRNQRIPVPPASSPPETVVADGDALALADRVQPFLLDIMRSGEPWRATQFRPVEVCFVRIPSTLEPEREDEAFDAVYAVLEHYDGLVEKIAVEGDSLQISAVFGLPDHTHVDDAIRAIGFAHDAHDRLTKAGIDVAIGVATDTLFCGLCGSDTRLQFMLYGRGINLAARLSLLRAAGAVCDQEARLSAERRFFFEPIPPARFKGFGQPVPVYVIKAERARPLMEMVGRQADTQFLMDALLAEPAARFTVTGVVGEAGLGKSRLLKHIGDIAASMRMTVVATAGSEVAPHEPYLAWRQVLLGLIPGSATMNDRELASAIDSSLAHEPRLVRFAPLLADIVPIAVSDPQIDTSLITGRARADTIQELLAAVVQAHAMLRRVVVLIDDAQWVDASSTDAFLRVGKAVPQLVLLGGARMDREDPIPDLFPKQSATVRRLEGLDPEAIAELARNILGVSTFPADLAAIVHERSRGNPLHAEEGVRILRDRGFLVIEGSSCHAARGSKEDINESIPKGLEKAIFKRFDKLPAAIRPTLLGASILRRPFTAKSLVEAFSPMNRTVNAAELLAETAANLAALESADFVRSTGDDGAFEFKHAVARDVVYSSIAKAELRTMHHMAIAWLDRLNDGSGVPPSELAYHWEGAENYRTATEYLETAARQALAKYAGKDAVGHLEALRKKVVEHHLTFDPARHALWDRMQGDAEHSQTHYGKARPLYSAALRGLGFRYSRVPRMATARELVGEVLSRTGVRRRPVASEADRVRYEEAAHIFANLSEESFFERRSTRLVYETLASVSYAERADSRRDRMNAYAALAIGLGIAKLPRLARYYSSLAKREAYHPETATLDLAYFRLLSMVLATVLGDWDEAERLGPGTSELFRPFGDNRWHASHIILFYAHFCREDIERARPILTELARNVGPASPDQSIAWVNCTSVLLKIFYDRSDDLKLDSVIYDLSRRELDPSGILLCTGILTAGYLYLRKFDEARTTAVEGLHLLRQGDATVGNGYLYATDAIADALLMADEVEGSKGPSASSRSVCRVLRRYARRLDVYRPSAWYAAGRLAHLSGRESRARRYWSRSAEEATRLNLVFFASRARSALEGSAGPRASVPLGSDGQSPAVSGPARER